MKWDFLQMHMLPCIIMLSYEFPMLHFEFRIAESEFDNLKLGL